MATSETHKISLWIENDEGLYNMAREHEDGSGLEDSFLELLEQSPEFALAIVKDLLGPVDWDAILESVKAE